MDTYQMPAEQQSFYESLPTPFAVYRVVDHQLYCLALSDGYLSLFGLESRERAYDTGSRSIFTNIHPDDVLRVQNAIARFVRDSGKYEVIFRFKADFPSGYRLVHAFGRHVFTEDGSRLAQVWFADEGAYIEDSDRNESKLNTALNIALREETLVKENRYNSVTGLENMAYFFEVAEGRRDAILQSGKKPALLFVDLSGMKFFNHKHGFEKGNELLLAFSRVLARLFGEKNCAHFGQDHFVLIAVSDNLDDQIALLFREAEGLNEGDSLPVRVGVYRDEGDGVVPVGTACDRAKIACDSLKGCLVSSFCYYRQEFRENLLKKRYILENFEKALSDDRIAVYYQPIIRAVSGKVCDEEALSRWIDPEKGLLSPEDFIPVLEEAKLIYKLDLYVLDRVLEKMQIYKRTGILVVPHSINLSRSDFDCCDIVEEVRKRVDASGIDRSKISIEITESIIGNDHDFIKEQVSRFRALGFRVWMDDFGSGYSSLNMLQSIKFDLIKFDMSFMKRLDKGEDGKIVLTELMKLATALGLDTVCEGVETEEQARFLREIGCSKLQGYYFSKPVSLETILDIFKKGKQIGHEKPEESPYFEEMGRVNLYDLAVLAADGDRFEQPGDRFKNFFHTLPMGVIEVRGNTSRFVRSNSSYRDFIKRSFNFDLAHEGSEFIPFNDSFMNNVVNTCCKNGVRAFYDETMPDGTVVHSFARKVAYNAVTDTYAIAVAVLSITPAGEGATYASISRALAADYYNIYYVDLDNDTFIEYTSPVGGESLAMERHGEHFFEECVAAGDRIYEEDRAPFFSSFSKEKVLKELDRQGVYNATYRLVDTGTPMYAQMKITRMQKNGNRLIVGISIIDAQMKQKKLAEEIRQEKNVLARIMALSNDYLSLYSVDPETGRYVEYSTTDDYSSMGLAVEGDDFFAECAVNGKRVVFGEDLPEYLNRLTKENILHDIRSSGAFRLNYRLLINGEPRQVSLKIASVKESDGEKLVVGVRARRHRH